jgi:murein DD-endopeptidase MepM/ murein hydrolase activator NlpD
MIGKKHKEIIIVPPGGKGVRIVHVPRGLIVFFLILIFCGFAGYFIPFNNFTLDVVEKNQKHNLDEQNKRLLSEIRPTRKYLENLDNEIVKLEQKKQKISSIIGINVTDNPGESRPKNVKPSILTLDELISLVTKEYELFSSVSSFSDKISGKTCFDAIPVIKPVVSNSFTGARFGKCKDPFTGYIKMHYGIDFFVTQGTPVIATASGVVTKVEDGRMWGRRIFISHDHGFSTVYAHLGNVVALPGKKVKKGEQIATVGISGLSTGIHVHYEIWHNGKAENPEEYFFPNFADSSSDTLQNAVFSEAVR